MFGLKEKHKMIRINEIEVVEPVVVIGHKPPSNKITLIDRAMKCLVVLVFVGILAIAYGVYIIINK